MTSFSTAKPDLALGAYLLVSAVVSAVYYSLAYSSGVADLFWFCNIALILAGAGFLTKNGRLLSAVLVTAIPAQFFWIIADLGYLFGQGTAGRLHWLGAHGNPVGFFFDLNYHFIVIPLGIFGVWRHGYHRKAFVTAVSMFLLLLLASRFFTPAKDNINCVFYPCDAGFTDDYAEIYGVKYFIARCVSFVACVFLTDLVLRRTFPRASS